MLKWYGYKHVNGSLHLKRFSGDALDVVEARTFPYVDICIDPFEADTYDEALHILKEKLKP